MRPPSSPAGRPFLAQPAVDCGLQPAPNRACIALMVCLGLNELCRPCHRGWWGTPMPTCERRVWAPGGGPAVPVGGNGGVRMLDAEIEPCEMHQAQRPMGLDCTAARLMRVQAPPLTAAGSGAQGRFLHLPSLPGDRLASFHTISLDAAWAEDQPASSVRLLARLIRPSAGSGARLAAAVTHSHRRTPACQRPFRHTASPARCRLRCYDAQRSGGYSLPPAHCSLRVR